MEDLFGINAHRQAVQENIEKAFDLGFDADNNIEGIEKAKHQVGDIHPNGRWVWTEWAPGKFDWKSLKGKHHNGSQQNKESKKDKQPTEVEIDNNEYKKQYDIVLKQLMSGSDENKSAFNFGLNIVRGNISNTKKELKELKETRPGAKKAIQKLESDLVKFYSQEKAFNDALKTAKTSTEDKVEENKKDNNKKKFTESSFKNSFDSIISNISSIVDKVFVEKPVGRDDSIVDKTYKTSDWKNGVHIVGNDFYGKSELLQLDINKKGGNIGTIQLRKYISNGMGSMYNNKSIGHVIVEVYVDNDWVNFDMTKENSRKDFAELLNKNIKK